MKLSEIGRLFPSLLLRLCQIGEIRRTTCSFGISETVEIKIGFARIKYKM